jgi:ubiquinone/menaquinone biosynthesis C-methylase UbiE
MTTDALNAFRRAVYEIAEAIAPSWERRRAEVEEVATPVREWMLRELRPREGDTVLELAAGVGETGFQAAAVVGEHGRLITSDFSPAMLEPARRGGELGVKNVEYRLIDAERIKLDADSVDGVLCRFGYMLMADPAAALAETRRVLRPGGRLTLAVWGALERTRSSARSRAASSSAVTSIRRSPLRPRGPSAWPAPSAQGSCLEAPASRRGAPRRWRCGSRCLTSTST